jgi:hypothetical protein
MILAEPFERSEPFYSRIEKYANWVFNVKDPEKKAMENQKIYCNSMALFNEKLALRDWNEREVEKRLSEEKLRIAMEDAEKHYVAGPRRSRMWKQGRSADFSKKTCEEVSALLGVKKVQFRNLVYYGQNFYMGWHNNANVPGERVYFALTEESNKSGLRYWDGEKIVTSYDQAGVTMRRFTIPEPSEGYFWHSVFSYTNRASMGFRILER